MLGFYNYTVILTYIGLISAVCGIYSAFNGSMLHAVFLLMFSGFCDMFDGKIARTKKDRTEDEKSFGIQIDSLCDIVCFGVLPACILFSMGGLAVWQVAAAAVFVLCGLIRLAFFNVTEQNRNRTSAGARKVYTGLPITASAIFVPLVMCFASKLGTGLPAVYAGVLLLLAACYVMPFQVKKPGSIGGVILLIAGIVIFSLFILLNFAK